MAGFVMVEVEPKKVAMFAFYDHGRIMNEYRSIKAAEIGHRHHQVQPRAWRKQGFVRCIRSLHGCQAIQSEGGESTAIQGRLEPARAQELRNPFLQFGIDLGADQALSIEPCQQEPYGERPEDPLT